MNRLASLALAALFTPVAAHAVEWNSTGQWLDTRRHIVADDAHLGYAKAVCHAREGTYVGGPIGPGYVACMKTQGFAFIVDSPAQIAARKKTVERVQPQVVIVPAPPAVDFTLHGCNGQVQSNGSFNTLCY